jgi:hypothetical protein
MIPKVLLNYRPNERTRLERPLKRLFDEAETGLSKPDDDDDEDDSTVRNGKHKLTLSGYVSLHNIEVKTNSSACFWLQFLALKSRF